MHNHVVTTKASEKKFPDAILIHLAGFFLLAASLAINPLEITRAFFSDEAVYYSMAYSFANDGDMEYQLQDLVRVYSEFAAGPQGIILKLNTRDKTIVYGKSFLYGLVAAPFVALFKTNGFFTLHALLLYLNLLCAYRFCRSVMSERSAVMMSFFYFLLNATLLYMYWMTPEYFNMSLVCYAVFFFVSAGTLKSEKLWFRAPWNYYIAAVFFGLATYSKPTNALLVIPLGIWLLVRKQVLAAMITLTIYIFSTVALFGANMYLTGEWNYQKGTRAAFYTKFPYDRPGASPYGSFKKKRTIAAVVAPPFIPKTFAYNWMYFPFGRFSGFAIYFFPMFFALLFVLFTKKDSLSKAVYIAGWVGILTYMVGIPWNYFGGSGTIGNRYLFNAYAVLLFAVRQEPRKGLLPAGIMLSLAFTGVLLYTPVLSSFDNSFHQKGNFFRHLPSEMSLLSDLPINTNIRARRVVFDNKPTYFAYFLDDDTYFMEPFDHRYGFWVKGGRDAELIIRSFSEVRKMRVIVKSLVPRNRVIIDPGKDRTTIDLKETVFYQGEVALPEPFYYDRDGTGKTFLYKVRITAEKGLIVKDQAGERYLGAFVRLELPEAAPGPLIEQDEDEDVAGDALTAEEQAAD